MSRVMHGATQAMSHATHEAAQEPLEVNAQQLHHAVSHAAHESHQAALESELAQARAEAAEQDAGQSARKLETAQVSAHNSWQGTRTHSTGTYL